MKKSLFLSLTIIISIFTFCSCGLFSKTPTSVVKDYSNDFKKNLDNEISKPIVSAISGDKNQKEIDKVKETLKKSLSNLKVETKEETVTDNSATVTVDITGVSLDPVISSVLETIESDDFTKQMTFMSYDDYNNKITDLILESIEKAEPETRTCTFNLDKKDGTYIIKNNANELCGDFWGTNLYNIHSLEH